MIDIEGKYADLSRNYTIYSICQPGAFITGFAVFFALMFLVGSVSAQPIDYTRMNMSLIALLSFITATVAMAIKARDTKLTDQEISTVKAFRAYDAISKFINTRKPSQRKTAQIKIRELNTEISGWVGVRMPASMQRPLVELHDAIERRVLPKVIASGSNFDEAALDIVKRSLKSLMTLLNVGITFDAIKAVTTELEILPEVAKENKSEETTKSKSSISSSASVIKHGSIVSGLAVVSGAICYFALSPIAKGDIIGPIQTSLETAGIVSALYFGLTMFLVKNQKK